MPPEQRREQLIDAALSVILSDGYGGVSIEAVAREAGSPAPCLRPLPQPRALLQALVEREERYSLAQLDDVVPASAADRDPMELLATSVRRFLESVTERPATWRLILLPLEGMPSIVRDHVESNRARIVERIGGASKAPSDGVSCPRISTSSSLLGRFTISARPRGAWS